MLKLFKANLCFFVPYFAFLITALSAMIIFTKAEIHIWFNGFHTHLLDKMIPVYTYLGDGTVAFILLIAFLFVKFRYAIASALSNVFVILSTYVLKQIIFNNEPRPRRFFTEIYTGAYDLYLVPGTNPEWMDSFPSGHTTTAFATYFLIAAVSKNNYVKTGMFLLALSVGYTRIYMSNHFLQDVAGGAFLGVALSLTGLWIADKIRKDWAEKSLLTRKSEKTPN
jgi:membrane-associated phospholipid phosphatase